MTNAKRLPKIARTPASAWMAASCLMLAVGCAELGADTKTLFAPEPDGIEVVESTFLEVPEESVFWDPATPTTTEDGLGTLAYALSGDAQITRSPLRS
jgi:hypothetical protein